MKSAAAKVFKYLLFCAAVVVLTVLATWAAAADLPDGAVLMYRSHSPSGRALSRYLESPFCHIGIVLDNHVYEATPPAVRRLPLDGYRYGQMQIDAYLPKRPFSSIDVGRMRREANRQLGRPYRLRRFFRPGAQYDPGTWCSRFTADVLGATSRYEFRYDQYHEPQDVFDVIEGDYYRWNP